MIDVERCVQQVIDERTPCSVKRDYIDRKNRYICSTETFLPEFDAKHRLCGVLLIATGRYEEVEAMKRRLEEEEKFYDIFNNVGIPIAVSEKKPAKATTDSIWSIRPLKNCLASHASILNQNP